MKLPGSKTAVVLYVAAIFAVGAVAGGAVGYSRKPPQRKFDPEAMRKHQTERYVKELALSPDQTQKLELILRQGMDEFGACHREHMDRIHALMKQGKERIAAILTPEQKAQFEKLEKEREEKFQREGRSDRRSPPPGHLAPAPSRASSLPGK